MSRQLRIASVYKVELEYGGLCNDEQRAFLRLLYLFDIETYQGNDENYLEVERAELEYLRGILAGDNETYTENAEAVEDILMEANLMRERMISALDIMIAKSDPDDSLVHIFFD